MSLSIDDERALGNLKALTRERREELSQKIIQTEKELRAYLALLAQPDLLEPREKIILGGYRDRFSNLKDTKAIQERLSQLSKYQTNLEVLKRQQLKRRRGFEEAEAENEKPEKRENKEATEARITQPAQEPEKYFFPSYPKVEVNPPPPHRKSGTKLEPKKLKVNRGAKDLLKEELLKTHGSLDEALLYIIANKSEKDFALNYQVDPKEMIEELLESGADPNYKDEEGNPVLGWAIYFYPEMVEVLLKHHANPNGLTGNGYPLLWLALSPPSDLSIVEKLLAAGANPHGLSNIGFTNMDVALVTGNVEGAKLLNRFVKKDPSQKVLMQKLRIFNKMGSVLGVPMTLPFHYPDGSTVEVSSMGGFRHYSISWITQYLDRFCKKLKSEKKEELYQMFTKILAAYTLEARRGLLDPKVGFKEVTQAYEKGEPVFVVRGWKDHDIGVAFYKNKGGFINRGEAGMHQDYGTGVFTLPEKMVLDEALFNSFQSWEKNGPEVMKKISDLAEANDVKPLATKYQKWGSCYYANTKPGVEVFLYWLSLEAGMDEQNAKAFALREYKEFTEFTRNEMCLELVGLYRVHPEDREFYEKMFAEVIKIHNGSTVSPYSRNYNKKMLAELRRAAMLIQAIADVDKSRAKTFLESMPDATCILKAYADIYYKSLSDLINECLTQQPKPIASPISFQRPGGFSPKHAPSIPTKKKKA